MGWWVHPYVLRRLYPKGSTTAECIVRLIFTAWQWGAVISIAIFNFLPSSPTTKVGYAHRSPLSLSLQPRLRNASRKSPKAKRGSGTTHTHRLIERRVQFVVRDQLPLYSFDASEWALWFGLMIAIATFSIDFKRVAVGLDFVVDAPGKVLSYKKLPS